MKKLGRKIGAQQAAWNARILKYKRKARLNNRVWALSTEQAIALFQGVCVYCGTKPVKLDRSYATMQLARSKTTNFKTDVAYFEASVLIANGIDRIDNVLLAVGPVIEEKAIVHSL